MVALKLITLVVVLVRRILRSTANACYHCLLFSCSEMAALKLIMLAVMLVWRIL